MKAKFFLFNTIVGLLLLSVSCTKPQEDIPPVIENDIEANMTIAELQALYTVSNDTLYKEIPKGTIIAGVVTSNDKEKNCYQ